MLNRHDLFKWFCAANPDMDLETLREAFRMMDDLTLAKLYNLKLIRRGYFVR